MKFLIFLLVFIIIIYFFNIWPYYYFCTDTVYINATIPEQKEIIRTIEPSGKQTAKRVAIVDRTNNISKIKSTNLNSDTSSKMKFLQEKAIK